jgi:predicted ester cyclase
MAQDSSSEQEAKVGIVTRLFEEVWNKGKRDLIPEIFTDPAAVNRGMEKVFQMRIAFPDLRFEVERYESEGDFVIVYFKAHGTHEGELMGKPPTGKKIVFDGSNIYRVRGGKIHEGWGHLNTQDALRDLFK